MPGSRRSSKRSGGRATCFAVPPEEKPEGYDPAVLLLEREALLAELSRRLSRARHGRGGIVLVRGEAGAGKTSLVRAFTDGASQSLILRGGCDPIVPARPFAPVRDMVDQVPALARSLEAGNREAIFDALLATCRRTGSGPTIIVIEDLHWADEPTLDLLRVLGLRIQDLPALLVGTYRDDETAVGHPLRLALGDLPRDDLSELDVPPLSPAAVATLVGRAPID